VSSDVVANWLEALERRHLADLTPAEVARALRALSSCYVERRARLSHGGALETRGKRAAFALFYGPVHFLICRNILRTLSPAVVGISEVLDLGCGTGTAGAAWALEAGARRLIGVDQHPWAVAEASWTYAHLRLIGHTRRGDVGGIRIRAEQGTGVVVAYTVNELPEGTRATLLRRLLEVGRRGSRVLVIEPIARRVSRWWDEWHGAFERAGGASREWRFPADLPDCQRQLARAAGLDPRELTARSLLL
jgi:hypothetical protein